LSTNIKKITDELHKSFHFFDKTFYNNSLPEPSILVQNRGNRKNVLGWCTVNKTWRDYSVNEKKYEITLVAEYLHLGMLPILSTLLHEMAHLYNLVNNIKDTTRGGSYHNKKFKEIAGKSGLIIEHHKSYGWTITRLQQATINLIKNSDIKEEAFTIYRIDPSQKQIEDEEEPELEETLEKPKSSRRKYICPSCDTKISATREVSVICGDCGVAFEEIE
jgi:SprT-like family